MTNFFMWPPPFVRGSLGFAFHYIGSAFPFRRPPLEDAWIPFLQPRERSAMDALFSCQTRGKIRRAPTNLIPD